MRAQLWDVYFDCINSQHGYRYTIYWVIEMNDEVRTAEDAVDKALTYCAGREDRIVEARVYSQKPHTFEIKTEALPRTQYEFKRGIRQ